MTLADEVRALLGQALALYAGRDSHRVLAEATARLDEPVRVAIAGKVKAGKSTLLNALVGEELAPTDAGECTRLVTWYHDGVTALVTMHPHEGEPRQLRWQRDDGALAINLEGTQHGDIERLDVSWPSQRLRDMTLIDTPGIESISRDVSQRSVDFLAADDTRAPQADAVLYLMRHVHSADVSFLEAFHDEDLAQPTPINAIGVLSRADEIGACRLDALDAARGIAARYRNDPSIQRLCQTVLPVAGLVAQASSSLTESEFRALAALAATPPEVRDGLALSADRFAADDDSLPVTAIEREDLLERLGLYGVRVAIDALSDGSVTSARELVDLFGRTSGLAELRETVLREFAARAGVLKARSALDALAAALRSDPVPGADALEAELERVLAGAHELAEIRLLNHARGGALALNDAAREDLELLLRSGTPQQRLGLPDTASDGEVHIALLAALARWQARAENPLSAQPVRDAARVVVRTCEGLLASAAVPPA